VRNIDKSRIEPAQVNGENVPIWFQYTVQFEKRAGSETITLFPHQFYGIEGSGDGYTGPQRYYNPPVLWCRFTFGLWFKMMIPAEGGMPTNVSPVNPDASGTCETRTRSMVEKGLYIPAFLNGVAVEAPYLELWWRP
jgi:hypothetical protein